MRCGQLPHSEEHLIVRHLWSGLGIPEPFAGFNRAPILPAMRVECRRGDYTETHVPALFAFFVAIAECIEFVKGEIPEFLGGQAEAVS